MSSTLGRRRYRTRLWRAKLQERNDDTASREPAHEHLFMRNSKPCVLLFAYAFVGNRMARFNFELKEAQQTPSQPRTPRWVLLLTAFIIGVALLTIVSVVVRTV